MKILDCPFKTIFFFKFLCGEYKSIIESHCNDNLDDKSG